MKAAQIKREIQVLNHLLHQLNECLVIFYKEKMHTDFKNTLKDIQICKKELRKLKAARLAGMEAEKGVASNAVLQRSGKSIS